MVSQRFRVPSAAALLWESKLLEVAGRMIDHSVKTFVVQACSITYGKGFNKINTLYSTTWWAATRRHWNTDSALCNQLYADVFYVGVVHITGHCTVWSHSIIPSNVHSCDWLNLKETSDRLQRMSFWGGKMHLWIKLQQESVKNPEINARMFTNGKCFVNAPSSVNKWIFTCKCTFVNCVTFICESQNHLSIAWHLCLTILTPY